MIVIKVLLYIVTLAASALYLIQKNDKKMDKYRNRDDQVLTEQNKTIAQNGVEHDEAMASSISNPDC